MIKKLLLCSVVLLTFTACSQEKVPKGTQSTQMKCGAGKCGANMFDGNSALTKKKKNILSQMREDDTRKDCVIRAKNTKEAYDCVRSSKTQKMSLKCGGAKTTMKCGAGKCGK